MTVSSDTSRVSYSGDGSTVTFAVPFYFLNDSDLLVVHRDADGVETTWTLNTQYTVSGAGDSAGGSITAKTTPTDYTPAASESVVILRDMEITQETDYVENDAFTAEAHERALDKLTMINQQQTEELARSIKLPISSSLSGITFPEAVAGAIIKWNAAGTDLEAAVIADISTSLDATFTSLASGDMIYYDGTAWANRTAAATLTALGAEPADSDIAKTDTAASWTAPQYFTDHTDESSSGAVTFDFAAGNILEITLDENITGITLSNMTANGIYEIWFTQAAGGYTVSGWSGVTWHTTGGTAPTMNGTNGAVMIVQLRKNAAGIFGSVQNAG
jgi:hypothetical protein